MAGVFISYRRDDSQGFAGRLADDLTDHFGADLVFRDVEIPIGQDFTEVLQRAIKTCDALVVVIGRNWLSVTADAVQPRLFEPLDWVRKEIEMAFTYHKPVIPVLVGNAVMPAPAELPATIRRLTRVQALPLDDRSWDQDVAQLVAMLSAQLPEVRPAAATRRGDESLAEVMRVLRESVTPERSRKPPGQPRLRRIRRALLAAVGRGLVKFLSPVFLLVIVYIGIRLFGDAGALRLLDRLEARLLLGWERLLEFIGGLR